MHRKLDQPRRFQRDKGLMYQRLQAMMEESFGVNDYDPIVRAVYVAERAARETLPDGSPRLSPSELAGIHLRVAEYVYPRLRAVDHSGQVETESDERRAAYEVIAKALG